QLTYPRATGPRFVDWVDYREAIRDTPVLPFAQMLVDRAGADHNVWLVWSTGYKSFGKRCEQLAQALGGHRTAGDTVRIRKSGGGEQLGLTRFAPGSLYEGPYRQRCLRPPGC